jgi:hypothetical protein
MAYKSKYLLRYFSTIRSAAVPFLASIAFALVFSGPQVRAQTASISWAPRTDDHQILEPIGDHVLTNVGQNNGADVSAYTSFASAVRVNPAVWMYYETIGDSPSAMMRTAQQLASKLKGLTSDTVLLQIGLDLIGGWSGKAVDRKVAAGEYDANIQGFCGVLQYFKRPAYIRIGYEFNGSWNHYHAKSYVAAFRRIAPMLRNCGVPVALVWDVSPAVELGAHAKYMSYYPGDQFVDWWGINLLADASNNFDFTSRVGLKFLADAEIHGKPVMTGEATAVGVGAQGGVSSWDGWFAPYFRYIYSHPGIKMFTYLNDNFLDSPWPSWGNCSIPESSVVAENMRHELENSRYILRTPGDGVLNTIHLESAAASPPSKPPGRQDPSGFGLAH